MEVCAVFLVHGRRSYHRAAREAVRAVLARSEFDVFVARGRGVWLPLPQSRRLRVERLRDGNGIALDDPDDDRAGPFLLKFAALEAWLRASRASHVLLIDADAVIVAPTTADDVAAALGDHPLAMVEQTGIRGSDMNRSRFLDHYVRHSLAFLAPEAAAPELDDFRFFNSGVVLATRGEVEAIVAWAHERLREARRADRVHRVGEHMIADQDYLQVWANSVHPGRCRELDWHWNHCEHWDDPFPRADARILHFSNFCAGPSRTGLARIRAARRGRWPAVVAGTT